MEMKKREWKEEAQQLPFLFMCAALSVAMFVGRLRESSRPAQ
jgi:hypothetical protein